MARNNLCSNTLFSQVTGPKSTSRSSPFEAKASLAEKNHFYFPFMGKSTSVHVDFRCCSSIVSTESNDDYEANLETNILNTSSPRFTTKFRSDRLIVKRNESKANLIGLNMKYFAGMF